MLMLRKYQFFVPQFAFVRIGRYNGRRTHVSGLTLTELLEARNKSFKLSDQCEDITQCVSTLLLNRMLTHV